MIKNLRNFLRKSKYHLQMKNNFFPDTTKHAIIVKTLSLSLTITKY